MTTHITHVQVLRALQGDEDLLTRLVELGFVKRRVEGYLPEEVERALVSYTLVRELGVNWEGVEVVLRLREDLLATRRQVAGLLELMRELRSASPWESRGPR
ncbi:MAG: hypothetical protein JW940_05075 [Polyangiaceae bacterium]|nr:hypothetical protein [Polyangiaceae bacterium]